jgi:hypothetical protein
MKKMAAIVGLGLILAGVWWVREKKPSKQNLPTQQTTSNSMNGAGEVTPTTGMTQADADSVAAIGILDAIPEIQTIKKAVIKAGNNPFFQFENLKGEMVTISLHEDVTGQPQTNRIETFNVNLATGEITIYDVVNNTNISYDEWKKTVADRFK